MDIDTKWVKDFIVLSNTLNFSKAAQLRYVTQPAFSRRIKALENALDCQLFTREKSPITLTVKGQAFQETAIQIISTFEQGVSALKIDNQLDIQLKFATTHTLSMGIYPIIAQHLASFPSALSTELKIADADDCTNMLINNECDFLLSFSSTSLNSQLERSLLIGNVRLIPVCIPDKNGKPFFELSNKHKSIPYLAYQSNIHLGRVVNKLISQFKSEFNINKTHESSMADNLKMMALQGLGVAWIPEFSIQHELNTKALVICGDKKWQPELKVRLYHSKNNTETQKEVWDYLKNSL
jgi:DNA-binding transcriptional LysR family regulator